MFIIRSTKKKGTAGEFIIWVSCIFHCLLCGFNCGLAAFAPEYTRVSRASERGMSEAATSPQDRGLRRESHEPALPPAWISAVTQGGKGAGY